MYCLSFNIFNVVIKQNDKNRYKRTQYEKARLQRIEKNASINYRCESIRILSDFTANVSNKNKNEQQKQPQQTKLTFKKTKIKNTEKNLCNVHSQHFFHQC